MRPKFPTNILRVCQVWQRRWCDWRRPFRRAWESELGLRLRVQTLTSVYPQDSSVHRLPTPHEDLSILKGTEQHLESWSRILNLMWNYIYLIPHIYIYYIYLVVRKWILKTLAQTFWTTFCSFTNDCILKHNNLNKKIVIIFLKKAKITSHNNVKFIFGLFVLEEWL